jgi:hypothetical protein
MQTSGALLLIRVAWGGEHARPGPGSMGVCKAAASQDLTQQNAANLVQVTPTCGRKSMCFSDKFVRKEIIETRAKLKALAVLGLRGIVVAIMCKRAERQPYAHGPTLMPSTTLHNHSCSTNLKLAPGKVLCP